MFSIFRRKPKKIKRNIRPTELQDFTGQENAKMILSVAINSAKQRKTNLDHVVVYGPPGLGKTTLAGIITSEMGSTLHTSIGTTLQTQASVLELFEDVYKGDIVFIDEIHRIPVRIEELLYTAMEDGYIDVGKLRIVIPKFTLIGATTKLGDLSAPMRDRFGIQVRLELYNESELSTIARRTASVLGVNITESGVKALSSVARGTPRILNSFIKRAVDVALATGVDSIDETVAYATLDMLEIDELGLDRMDRNILGVMVIDYECKPVGINTLATSVGENAKTIQEVYEPYLIASGLILPTSRGRIATKKAIEFVRGY